MSQLWSQMGDRIPIKVGCEIQLSRLLANNPCLAGKRSLVFDAVFNSSLKSRTLKDPEFKTFLIELAFQRVEAQTSSAILLSRQIGTPNIASKGKLEPRTVQIPRVLYPEGHPYRDFVQSGKGKKKLIE